MIYYLSEDSPGFPDPRQGEKDGLFAVGGDLSPDWLLLAYSHGIFPWFPYRSEIIQWYCPMKRFVIVPEEIHISHSLRQLLKSERYQVTWNKAFDQVIEGCSAAQGRNEHDGAWLGGRMLTAYKELNHLGFAASVEVWEQGSLVGGLYGVTIGQGFMGESMFSLAPSASKVALVYLASVVGTHNGLIDCQFETPHLKAMGGRAMDYEEYLCQIGTTYEEKIE